MNWDILDQDIENYRKEIQSVPSDFYVYILLDPTTLADRSAKTTEQRSKFWKITFSDGSSIEIKNLKKFAAENNFNYQQLKYHGNLNKMSSFGIKVEKLSP